MSLTRREAQRVARVPKPTRELEAGREPGVSSQARGSFRLPASQLGGLRRAHILLS